MKGNYRHGFAKTRLDNIYYHMIKRCYKEKHRSYEQYGGRGIKVCDEWRKNKILFFEWAIKQGYSDNLTLDRIDVNGDYSPENCRWVDWNTQENNRTNNVRIVIGKENKTLAEWSRLSGVLSDTIAYRLKKGWNPEDAIFTPPKFKGGNTWQQKSKSY